MLKYIAGFIFSFLITNWCYSEICLFLPGFDKFARSVYQEVRIPTHNHWQAIFTNSSDSEFKGKIGSAMEWVGKQESIATIAHTVGITDPKVAALRDRSKEAGVIEMIYVRLFENGGNDVPPGWLTGAGIFSRLRNI